MVPITRANFSLLAAYLNSKNVHLYITSKLITLVESDMANRFNSQDSRIFAFTKWNDLHIYVAAAIEALPPKFRIAVLLHEVVHIITNNFGRHCEPRVDETILSYVPEAGYHYADTKYVNPLTGRLRTARNLQCVSPKFLNKLLRTRKA